MLTTHRSFFESVFVPEPNYFDYYSLKSGSMIPLALFFLRIVSAILGLLYFHINFKIICSISVKSSSVLNKSGKYGNPYPVPDLRGDAFSFSPLSTMMAVCLSYMALIMLRFVPSQEKTTHGHHQMANTKIILIIFVAAKDGEALHSQQKQDWELWLRS